jgi:membrane-bound lytic murein transglycosylase A
MRMHSFWKRYCILGMVFLTGCSFTGSESPQDSGRPAPISGAGQVGGGVGVGAGPADAVSTGGSADAGGERDLSAIVDAVANPPPARRYKARSAKAARAPLSGQLTPIGYEQLSGWNIDNLVAAWPAWLRSCLALGHRGEPFTSLCNAAQGIGARDAGAIRAYFESNFVPHALDGAGAKSANNTGGNGRSNHVTGYYEPLLMGSKTRSSRFDTPLYRTPKDLVTVDLNDPYPELRALRLRGRLVKGTNGEGDRVVPYATRGELEKSGQLRGLELVYVTDPVEAFFLQVQGSGRVQLDNGQMMRVGYANQNGHPYKSIGRWLVDKGELTLAQATMQGIKAWLAKNPQRKDELLHQNPSMVFFKELPASQDVTEGPFGSLGVPLTAGRSVAVDNRFVPTGLPVFVQTRIPTGVGSTFKPTSRLMFAQDTGSAIQGAHRADFFFGSGAVAGELAGKMKAQGSMVVLLPKGY